MTQLDLNDVVSYVEANIGSIQRARLNALGMITLNDILTRENPYLITPRNILIGSQLVRRTLDGFLSSEDESLFEDFLKNLAIFVCSKVYGREKTGATGIDLQFRKDQVTYVVSINSGPNWGNSRQIAAMKADFQRARRSVQTNNPTGNVVAVNGCCYGRCPTWNQGEYWKLCGQKFWEFISGDAELYRKIIGPLGHEAKERNEEFNLLYSQIINRLAREVLTDLMTDDLVDGNKLVEFVSADARPQFTRERTSRSDT